MIVKPTVVQLLEKAENRYRLVIATAKRARQISSGSKPMTDKDDVSPVTLAADEIEEDKVKIYNENEWQEVVKNKEENSEEIKNEEKEPEENDTLNSNSENE